MLAYICSFEVQQQSCSLSWYWKVLLICIDHETCQKYTLLLNFFVCLLLAKSLLAQGQRSAEKVLYLSCWLNVSSGPITSKYLKYCPIKIRNIVPVQFNVIFTIYQQGKKKNYSSGLHLLSQSLASNSNTTTLYPTYAQYEDNHHYTPGQSININT